MNTNYSKAIHFVKIFTYKLNSYLLPHNHLSHRLELSCPTTHAPLKVYTYDLPVYYQKNDDYDLDLVYQTFLAIRYFFVNCVSTSDPHEADYFFVPLNLHRFQVKNIDPVSVLRYCKYLGKKKNHLLIATGDFSQREGNNHYGSAYTNQYPWLKQFKLLALESSDDLIPNQDLGIIPFNTLIDQPIFNYNHRPYLYSFIGETDHPYLPKSHVRHRLIELKDKPDIFIGKSLSKKLRSVLSTNFITSNDYELMSRNSLFTLCPAGYGRWTYRFFQSIVWGSIPVIISDSYVLPFADSIPYSDFSLRVKESDFDQIDDIIRSIPKNKIKNMQKNLRQAQSHFTKNNFFELLSNSLVRQKS